MSTNKDRYEDSISTTVSDDENTIKGDENIHLIHFKNPDGCELYNAIKSGKKTVEGYKNDPVYQKIKVGDTLLLSDRTKGILECVVTYLHEYADLADYLAGEGLETVLGKLAKCRNIQTITEGVALYREFVDDTQILDLKEKYGNGFLGIGINFVHEYKKYFETLQEPWFSAIRDGKKIAEGRLDKTWVKSLNIMDMIEFTREVSGVHSVQKIEVLVTDVKRYKTFTDFFDDVGLDRVLPGKKTYEEGLAVYRKWYPEKKEKEMGVVGIFIKVIKK